MSKILVVDDEPAIVKGLKFALEQDGYEVDCAYDGGEALDKVHQKEYDIMLLDLMLPVADGMTVCTQVRTFSEMPIIMLTAKGEDMDKIMGLESGADDYITKPFNILEVKARIRTILRRSMKKKETVQKNVLASGDIRLERDNRRTFIKDVEIALTAKEYEVLELLVTNPDKVYSRDNLLNLVWGYDYPGDARTVDVHVRRLREKIEPNPSEPIYVRTKWGLGYYYTLS